MAAFTAPEELSNYFDIVEIIEGVEVITKKLITYANPALDLHSLTAKNCYSDAFINVPDYKIIDTASNTIRDGIAIRKAGKIVNFGLVYGQSPQALSDLNYIKLEVAESWVQGHKDTYPGFHKWAANVGRLAAVRGWARTSTGRLNNLAFITVM